MPAEVSRNFMMPLLANLMRAQRLALAAVGGSVDSPSKRKKPKARKTLKNAQSPARRGCTPCWAATIVITDCLLKLLEVPKEVLQFLDHEHSQTLSIRR